MSAKHWMICLLWKIIVVIVLLEINSCTRINIQSHEHSPKKIEDIFLQLLAQEFFGLVEIQTVIYVMKMELFILTAPLRV
jgi:hypothetical protein